MNELPMSVADGISLAAIFLCVALLCHLIQKFLEKVERRRQIERNTHWQSVELCELDFSDPPLDGKIHPR